MLLELVLALVVVSPGHTPAVQPGTPLPHLLFVDRSSVAASDTRLVLKTQSARKEGFGIIRATEPWEAWSIAAYNSLVPSDNVALRQHRMYYSCMATGKPGVN